MTWLSRLVLNATDPAVRGDLRNCHNLHSRIMSAFPRGSQHNDHAREAFGVLYRLESDTSTGSHQLLVQSNTRPDWQSLPQGYLLDTLRAENPGCKRVDGAYAGITSGMELLFRLRANPTRRVSKSKNPDDPLGGKRVELRGEDEWIAWVERKGVSSGFTILDVKAASDAGPEHYSALYPAHERPRRPAPDLRVGDGRKVTGRKGNRADNRKRHNLTFGSVLFEGRLRVTDAEVFRDTLRQGIGPAKAYGFGLLSIAPVPRQNGGTS